MNVKNVGKVLVRVYYLFDIREFIREKDYTNVMSVENFLLGV